VDALSTKLKIWKPRKKWTYRRSVVNETVISSRSVKRKHEYINLQDKWGKKDNFFKFSFLIQRVVY